MFEKMNLQLYDDSLYSKHQSMKSSGYLDDEYQLSPDFRYVQQYHFRIEDDHDILELKQLYKRSVPMIVGFQPPVHASSEFNIKMRNMLNCIDSTSHQRMEVNSLQAETHGYYKLGADAYDQVKTLEAAYEHIQLNSQNKLMEGLTIDNEKVKQKIKMRAKEVKGVMKEEKEEEAKKQLITKMKKMSIQDFDL